LRLDLQGAAMSQQALFAVTASPGRKHLAKASRQAQLELSDLTPNPGPATKAKNKGCVQHPLFFAL